MGKLPSETTQKYITGPNGQQFRESEDKDVEHGEEAGDNMQLDMSTTTSQEEAQATAVRDSVRRSVRASLLFTSLMWFLVFLSTFSVFFGHGSVAENVQEVSLSWPTKSVWPHAIAAARDEDVFIADKYRVYRVSLSDGNAREMEACQFTGDIADVATECGGGNCRPLVLLDDGRVVDCTSEAGNEIAILQQSSHGPPKHFALHDGSMMSLVGNSVIEYTSQAEPRGWRPLWKKASADGGATRSLAFGDEHIYLFERHSSLSKATILDRQKGSTLGSWAMPKQFSHLAAGSATKSDGLLLLPDGPAPAALWKWKPQV